MDLKELQSGVDPKTHWYYQSKKVPMMRFFNKLVKEQNKPLTIVDFGAGSGFFALEILEEYPDQVEKVLLVDINYSETELEVSKGKKVQKLHFIPDGLTDCIVLMMDVLEHIEDHVGIFADIFNRLGENSHFFITVPAFMGLWSGHDVYLGHFRRYTRKTLLELVNSQPVKLDNCYYIYGGIFPLAWGVRKLKNLGGKGKDEMPDQSDMGNVPPFLNSILKQYNSLEMKVLSNNKIAGLTCVAEGQIK